MQILYIFLFKVRFYALIVALATLLPPLLYILNWRLARRRVFGRTVIGCLLVGLAASCAAVFLLPYPHTPHSAVEVSLPASLVRHVHTVSQRHGVPADVLLAVMYNESRFVVDVQDNVNTNGTRDRGLCQINEVNWDWLRDDYGLDISLPEDNIEAGAIILAQHIQKYPLEQALAAYMAGPGGMRQGQGLKYAARVLGIRDALLFSADAPPYGASGQAV